MNTKRLLILFMIMIVGLLAACNSEDPSNTRVSTNDSGTDASLGDDMVRITISINDGEQFLNEQEVKIEESTNLLEVLEETFYVETNEENVITSIERMKVDEEANTEWVLFVNDEPSDTPAKDYSLTGGERIIFDLQ
ncbi:DUF4430 domain-containing protein [Oceanobacillus sp. CAU 1775]